MKIENTGKAYVPSPAQETRAPAARVKGEEQASGDSVQLSPLATLMKRAESAISNSPISTRSGWTKSARPSPRAASRSTPAALQMG